MSFFLKKYIVGIVALIVIGFLVYYFGISRYITLPQIKHNAGYLQELVINHYGKTVLFFIGFGVLLMMLSLPLTGPIAVCGGFLFGLWQGVLYSIIAVVIGISLSFLLIRYVLFRMMQNKYDEQLTSFNLRMREYGYSYLVTLQLLTVVPYFIINSLAALADVPFYTFVATTIIGSLPIVVIYAFAGRQLNTINSWSDILSWNMLLLLLGLAALALLPIVIRKVRRTNNP